MDNQELCLKLLHADCEGDVIALLRDAGYWDDPSVWRLYGDKEGNYATAGAQQAEPEAALVEKIVNSVDACLINECLVRRIDPESPDAPHSIRQAVARFYEDKSESSTSGGRLKDWSKTRRTAQAKKITLAATGKRRETSLTIVDQGEGQTPNRIPDTILSLNKKNKQGIHFVQGKFNMGGTGVLRHCHEHGLQLVISRRNPAIFQTAAEPDDSRDYWGFTLVRRERPSGKPGEVINSEFKYLAPLRNDPRGAILRFTADTLPLMPVANEAYARNIDWGTAIKLYGYDMSVGSSNILMRDGLLYRLEASLPEIALPVRVHECRKYFKGDKAKSFATNLAGLVVRLEEGKGDNLEHEPWGIHFSVHELKFTAKVYVFKRNKAKTYLKNQGVIFIINGQTHGYIPRSIFGRKKVGLTRLGKDLLVIVDCSDLPVDAREDLFMTSRDRLSKGELRTAVERQLEEILSTDRTLRRLQELRRVEEQSERLAGQKPLEDVLNNILKYSPSLSTLFLRGQRLNMPTKISGDRPLTKGGGDSEGGASGTNGDVSQYVGKKHPTYFRFQKSPKQNSYHRNCEQGRMVRVAFETDAENEYFTRDENRGRYALEVIAGEVTQTKIAHSLDLNDGVAQWSISLPHDTPIGANITVRCIVDDDVILEPFVNTLHLTVKPKTTHAKSEPKARQRKGAGDRGNKDASLASGLEMPRIEKVKKDDNQYDNLEFDDRSSCAVRGDRVDEDKEQYQYTFYINVDNIHLQQEMKAAKEPELTEAKYVYGNVLLGLSLIHDSESSTTGETEDTNDQGNEFKMEESVSRVSRAMSPFLVPMIDYLGNLSAEDVSSLVAVGDDD